MVSLRFRQFSAATTWIAGSALFLCSAQMACSSDAVLSTESATATTGAGAGTTGGGAASSSGTSSDRGGASTGSGSGTTGSGGASGSVAFVALGDTGKGNAGQSEVAASIAQWCADHSCDFVQLLGDNIYDSGVSSVDDPQWETKFEEPYARISAPFWAILGNHDYGGGGLGNEFSKGQFEIEYSNVSDKWRLPAAYYQRAVSNVEFFGLDTNMAMYLKADDQAAEVSGWITSSQATWKIVFGHHPYLSNGPHGNAGAYDGLPFIPITNGAGVKDLVDAVVCGKADLYLSGHDHSRQWLTESCNGTALAVSGTGASPTELPGKNSTEFQTVELGFIYVVIGGNVLTADFVSSTGQVEFTKTLTK